jgi:hypothetical protein
VNRRSCTAIDAVDSSQKKLFTPKAVLRGESMHLDMMDAWVFEDWPIPICNSVCVFCKGHLRSLLPTSRTIMKGRVQCGISRLTYGRRVCVLSYTEDLAAGACLLQLSDGSTAWVFSEEEVVKLLQVSRRHSPYRKQSS